VTTGLSNVLTYLRAMVRGEFDIAKEALRKANEKSWEDAGGLQVGAAFYLAARRRFVNADLAEIVTWVADLRAQLAEADDVDPLKAEHLIRAMVYQQLELVEDMDPHEVAQLELVLTYRLLQEWEPSDEELDRFLAEAETLAADWKQDD